MSAETDNQNQIKYEITPTSYLDYDAKKMEWNLEIHLPGVNKADIKFKVLPKYFTMEAIRDEARYSLHGHFPWEVNVDSVEGNYSEGLLYITGKIKDPMEDAFQLKVQ